MKFFTTSIFICLTSLLFSQVNIEKYNRFDASLGVRGSLSFYASAKTGNTDNQQFGVDGRINYSSEKYHMFLIGQGEYGWNKGDEYSNNALLHFRYLREVKKYFEPEFFTQINYNKSRLLLFRSLAGVGLRLSIISDTASNFDFGTAYMYEYEKLDLPETFLHADKTYNHRWSNYISFSSIITKISRLSMVIYVQPKINDFSDIRILSENHFGVALTDRLSLSINFSLRYDSIPPDGINDLDTNSRVGLTINL